MTNKFIVFEGLDGSGKGTQIEMLANALRESGEKVFVTAEPTDGESGKLLRNMLRSCEAKHPDLQAALFLADRIEHINDVENGIKRHLDDGYTVICDRYYYSSIAYQGEGSGRDPHWVESINLDCPSIVKPDLCIFLDVDPDECRGRILKGRSSVELFEQDIAQMRNIRSGFLKMFKRMKEIYGHNIVIIDANNDAESIAEKINVVISE